MKWKSMLFTTLCLLGTSVNADDSQTVAANNPQRVARTVASFNQRCEAANKTTFSLRSLCLCGSNFQSHSEPQRHRERRENVRKKTTNLKVVVRTNQPR